MYGYLYFENGGLELLPDDVGFIQNLSINAENLLYYVSGIRHVCVGLSLCMHAPWQRA